TPVGAGISLAPNALRVLDQLGLYQEYIAKEAQRLRKIQVHRNRTKWNDIDLRFVETAFGYPVYSMERHRFHHYLYEAAGGAEAVVLSAEVISLVDDDENGGPVRVTVADGREFTAEMAVGADGIRSTTRRILAQRAGQEAITTVRFTGR